MSRDALDRFRQIVFEDAALQRRLLDAVTPAAFLQRVQQAAAERDCEVSADDIKAAMADNVRGWLGRWQ